MMKMKLLAMATGVALGIAAAGCAHERDTTQTAGTDRQYNYVTGSYVPQDVQKSGPVTNGKDNVRIIDQSEIDRSGGANVEQTLRQLGATH